MGLMMPPYSDSIQGHLRNWSETLNNTAQETIVFYVKIALAIIVMILVYRLVL